MKTTLLWILALAALLLLAGCAAQSLAAGNDAAPQSYTQISQDEAKERMSRDDGHIIVDVRRQDEYDAGHIPGAVCIPNESIGDERPAELPDPDQIILVYCRSGNRSKQAAQKLFDLGYTNLYEFGGIIDWTGEIVEEPFDIPKPTPTLVIEVGDRLFYACFADNSSARAVIEYMSPQVLSLCFEDCGGFEKAAVLPEEAAEAVQALDAEAGEKETLLGMLAGRG